MSRLQATSPTDVHGVEHTLCRRFSAPHAARQGGFVAREGNGLDRAAPEAPQLST